MAEPITRLTLFVPGTPASAEAWSKALEPGGLRIERDLLRGDGLDATVEVELQELTSEFNVYQLAEDPMILSGQTFATDPETPRRLVERWPDTQYPPAHSCHNPYGVWRFGPPGGSARSMRKLLPVFMPALHVLLAAREKEGGPLTKQQVEGTRDRGSCIAMEPRDAQKLERTRGYSDLDPELVWEQWQVVREKGA